MLNTSSVGMDSSIDALLEEELQAVNLDEDVDDDHDDNDDVIIAHNGPEDFNFDGDLNDVELPPEMTAYLSTLKSQTDELEKEIEECDEILLYMPYQSKRSSQAVVPYDDYKELEQAAAEQGMTVEEFKQKVLKEAEENDFTEEDMTREFEEFAQLQRELAEVRAGIRFDRKEDQELILAIEGPSNDGEDTTEGSQDPLKAVTDGSDKTDAEVKEVGGEVVKYDKQKVDSEDSTDPEVGPLVSMAALTSMRDYIIEQLKKNEEWHEIKKQKLVQSIDAHKHEEEKRIRQEEERKKKLKQEQEVEEAALMERKKEKERHLEGELRIMDGRTAEELRFHQAEIEKLSSALEEEKHLFHTSQKQWMERLEETKKKAATHIQKVYRGHRTRHLMSGKIQELNEWKEARKEEKYKLRLMEVEYEMKYREEQAKKEKEDQEKREAEEKKKKEEEEQQRELEQKKREEEERIAEELRKEEEKKKEEARLAEEKKKKEEEEERKQEEARRKEEEKLRKEEEKKRKEEEKKRQKEEEKRKKEEEKKQKEEEKRRKEEEKRKKEEEEKKRKEEEKRKQEEAEEKKKLEEMKKSEAMKVEKAEDEKKPEEKSDGDLNANKDSSKMYENFVTNGETTAAVASTTVLSARSKTDNNNTQGQNQGKSQQQSTPRATASPVNNHLPHPPLQPPPQTKTPSSSVSGKAATIAAASQSTATAVLSPLEPHPSMPEPPPPKPDPVELQQMSWIKNCVPWSKVSNEPWKLKQTSQKTHKRPTHAKKLPPVSESVVLAAAQAETLRQVSSVKLTDLPGCSLSTLGQCWSLRYLTVTNCGLTSLDGLSQCKHLLYINAESNNIEYVDLKDLGSLQVLKLAYNNLSVIHGLEGCINLRWLDLTHNRITRISGLGALRRIHTLNLSNNQLVSCEGVEEAVTLQQLDLSHNYLQHFLGVSKMCLLTYLDLSANNLLEVPELKNQVLLQTLSVEENSIKSLAPLESYWLPLLHTLNCSQNLLEKIEGVDKLIMLSHLDVSLNQITELDPLTSGLTSNTRLESLVVEGNPFTEVYTEVYKKNIAKSLPFLKSVDRDAVKSSKELTDVDDGEDDFIRMCQSQIRLHESLKTEFDTQIKVLHKNPHITNETLCSTYFSYCDTSFKMASEHRSAHEYGDISVSSSISKFTAVTDKNVNIDPTPQTQTPRGSVIDRKSQFDAALNCNNSNSNALHDRKSQFDTVVNTKAQFDAVFASQGQSSVSTSFGSVTPNSSITAVSAANQPSLKGSASGRTASQGGSNAMWGINGQKNGVSDLEYGSGRKTSSKQSSGSTKLNSKQNANAKAVQNSSDSSDMSDSDVEGDKMSVSVQQRQLHPHPPPAPAPASYLNEKDKFEMALQGNPGQPAPHTGQGFSQNHFASKAAEEAKVRSTGPSGGQYLSSKDRFEMALQNQPPTNYTSTSAKDKFDAALQGSAHVSQSGQIGGHKPLPGVKADVVGSQLNKMEEENFEEFDLAALGLDGDFDFEALELDIDKYLDMGELDEFLEKGWRPSESPQIPQSSYPVLGKINPGSTSDIHMDYTHNAPYKGYGPTPPPPPHQPPQAWGNSPVPELRGKPPRPIPTQGYGAAPPPVPASPLSVASGAETMGGGSVRSKKEELSEEWGFKDSRTAEMMMARAKKMKYNAERKQKLRKLDPQQRLQLLRKLEETYKVKPVRPPPAKVLPRKEYFQAREEEVQRVEFERRLEENTRVHRTFEWLHTQVGDHPVSSSRINPGCGPAHVNAESNVSRQNAYTRDQYPRKTSPLSDHMDSVSQMGKYPGHEARRYSIGETYSGHTPTLPPIQVGSAPSSHKNERMSFRDTPVERSGGWGGGKKRGNRK